MRCNAAVLGGIGQAWTIEEIEVHPPKANEVLVRWKAAGLCHSDEHLVTGDMVSPRDHLLPKGEGFFPVVGGHEGAGVVAEVGPGVTAVQPGDHVAASFIPSCGRCRWCSTGRQFLCDSGAGTFSGGMFTDGTHRHFRDGEPIKLMAKVGTFSEVACVAESSLVKVDADLPLDVVALVSCGVATGWGSAANRADVRPGDTVVVVGVGGIGINAVQGAAMAGAKRVIAVDPVPFKCEMAMKLGATHAYASMEEAMPAVNELTWGQMADKVILAPSVMHGEMMRLGTALAGKDGTIVVTAVAPIAQKDSAVNLFELAMWNKEIKGTIFGSLNPRHDIPRLLGLYREGMLKLDELITRRYALRDINDGYQDMRDGINIRGVVMHD